MFDKIIQWLLSGYPIQKPQKLPLNQINYTPTVTLVVDKSFTVKDNSATAIADQDMTSRQNIAKAMRDIPDLIVVNDGTGARDSIHLALGVDVEHLQALLSEPQTEEPVSAQVYDFTKYWNQSRAS